MAPLIHIVRHAQAAHNATLDGNLTDAPLTVQGELQCASLRSSFPYHAQVTRVISSPLQRAMQTAILALARDEIAPVIALDTLQETGDAPSSCGAAVAELRERYRDGPAVDLSRVREGWNDKSESSIFEPEWEKLLERTRDARRVIRELARKEDGDVAVVAHGVVVHFLTEDWLGIAPPMPSAWANCEYRTYEFVDPTGQDDNATLRETDASWKRRMGDQIRPTEAEQMQMRKPIQTVVEGGGMKMKRAD